MMVTLEDELKKVRIKEHAAGMTHLLSKGFIYADVCDLAKTQYQEAKGVGSGLLHMPRTPRHRLSPSPTMKPTPLSNAFRRASPPHGHMTRAMTLETFVERKDMGKYTRST